MSTCLKCVCNAWFLSGTVRNKSDISCLLAKWNLSCCCSCPQTKGANVWTSFVVMHCQMQQQPFTGLSTVPGSHRWRGAGVGSRRLSGGCLYRLAVPEQWAWTGKGVFIISNGLIYILKVNNWKRVVISRPLDVKVFSPSYPMTGVTDPQHWWLRDTYVS